MFLSKSFKIKTLNGFSNAYSCSSKIPEKFQELKTTKQKTSIKKLETQESIKTDEVLKPWPNNTNPSTGEIGGPRGPEPTRYGDWERKGRVTDF